MVTKPNASAPDQMGRKRSPRDDWKKSRAWMSFCGAIGGTCVSTPSCEALDTWHARAAGGHPAPSAERERGTGVDATPSPVGPGAALSVLRIAADGGAGVLVGLAVFKTADGPHGPWWVRFPLPSATLMLV